MRVQIPPLRSWRLFGQLALEEVDVGLEAVPEPYLDREEVRATLLGFLARGTV